MGDVEIYWFSGTGNSLFLARRLAEKTGAHLKPLASLLNAHTISSQAEAVGLVFPVYDFKAPAIINDFINRFEGLKEKYLFALCTYGISPLKCLSTLQNQLSNDGIALHAGFGIMMPHNSVGNTSFSNSDRDKALAEGEKRVNEIARLINTRQTGPVETESLFSALLMRGLFLKVIKPVIPLLLHVAKNGWESLAFQTNELCSGCATCSKVCPVHNITLDRDRPAWGDKCLSCFACLQWCPNEAIQLGTGKIKVAHYHHPDINISDMFIACY